MSVMKASLIALGGLGASIPGAALACAVCTASAESQSVYLTMTIVMSLLPLGLIGLVAYLVIRASRAHPSAEESSAE